MRIDFRLPYNYILFEPSNRKGVPKLRDPALVCMSTIDKKSVYWSSSWSRILNVQDIIKDRTNEKSSNISSTCIPSTTIAGASQHSFNTCLLCTWYRGCRPTHQIPVQCWASIGSMLVNRLRRWHNTNLSPDLLYTLRKQVAFNQCCFNVDPQSSTLARHWNIIGWLYRVFWQLHCAGDTRNTR